MEDLIREFTLYVSTGLEAAAALVIAVAGFLALAGSARLFLRQPRESQAVEAVRLFLGRWLTLGLEFLIAADILRTVAAPTWTQIGQLATIILLRTLLTYTLGRDIAEAAREAGGEERRGGRGDAGTPRHGEE